jgi:hypothetical protein
MQELLSVFIRGANEAMEEYNKMKETSKELQDSIAESLANFVEKA